MELIEKVWKKNEFIELLIHYKVESDILKGSNTTLMFSSI
jgi:hypothetical protein